MFSWNYLVYMTCTLDLDFASFMKSPKLISVQQSLAHWFCNVLNISFHVNFPIAVCDVILLKCICRSVDGKVRNYDIRMGSMVVDSLDEPVTSVMLSQDSQCILVSTLDNCIRLLDKETGELLNEYVIAYFTVPCDCECGHVQFLL